MSDKPTYLKLLNALALAESAAGEYLSCWAATTCDPTVKKAISTVAHREAEHGVAFAKRINELGYEVKPGEPNPKQAKLLAIAASTELSDYEKMVELGFEKAYGGPPKEGPDVFSGFFDDLTIDIQTGALLGRYICEERDSGRVLRELWACAKAEHEGGAAGAADASATARLEAKVDALCAAIEGIQAQLSASASSNGRSKVKV